MVRTIFAGIVAGILIFVGGFLDHMVFNWVGRRISQLPNEERMIDLFKKEGIQPGIYGFPNLPADFAERPKDDQEKVWKEVNERYKQGPAAWLIVAPPGQDMMGTNTLLREFTSNLLLGVIMAVIVSHVPGGFAAKFGMALVLGFSHWLAAMYSYQIWYRYPMGWTLDELYCSLFEAALAGLALAAILPTASPAVNSGNA
ncbi:MAG TPA: hypothetical protein VIY86_00165 [Pirellulaceae bacterium]